MKLILKFYIGLVALCLASCKEQPLTIAPDHYLSDSGKVVFLNDIIRYIGKLPGKANHSNKFDTAFDQYFQELARRHRLDFFYADSNTNETYFLVSRIAPSIQEKYVGIGGKMVRNNQGELIHFEETFRTWKFPKDELLQKSEMLFRKMIENEDLSPYYTSNSGDDLFIEFPDEFVSYDKSQRMWVSTREDPMEPYYKLKEQTTRDQMVRDSIN